MHIRKENCNIWCFKMVRLEYRNSSAFSMGIEIKKQWLTFFALWLIARNNRDEPLFGNRYCVKFGSQSKKRIEINSRDIMIFYYGVVFGVCSVCWIF